MTDSQKHFHDQMLGDEAMYREEILEHYKSPHNAGRLADATFAHREINQSCGDTIDLYVRVGDSGHIDEVKFEGQGCAISQATVSMLTDHVKGMTLDAAARLGKDDIFALLGFPVGMTRLRCALLGLKTLQTGIATHSGDKSDSDATVATAGNANA